ncbi:hypothetical protein DQ237_16765 [Blastococcus sp. TF02-8]|uniref:hypothetical protein n=1 Tax=Blastococcus sp. TF02-8 TaxID=2250574 RepID=UPI000DEB209D|nr:hypothetical protein [Blastococcus sp. TF02-8]RBY93631.1 hypothetical protein DQ237_16765 [Blastococcus sp. TF02-8]
MNELTLLRDAGPEAPPLTPAARSAARAALLTEIEGPAPRRSRRPSRTSVFRGGIAVATAAAAWIAAVALTGPETADGSRAEPRGLSLVATEEITFPLSLDPEPPGMTPSFTGSAGSTEAIAGYTSPDGIGFTVYLSPEEPLWAADQFQPSDVTGRGTTTVGGVDAQYVVGATQRTCTQANVCFDDLPFAQLVWERAPGQWVDLYGEGSYGDLAALAAVGGSLVDRPQPIRLQVGLAPAGWSVLDWHESSGAVTFIDDQDPSRVLGVQCMPEAPSGVYEMDNGSVEQRIAAVTAIDPAAATEIGGAPAQIVHARDDVDPTIRFWLVAWELPDATVCTVTTPEEFSPADVLAIAGGVAYTP